MSGIDEQTGTFECPNCGDTAYWVLEGQRVDDGSEELLGFLNNPDKNDDPPFEIAKRFREMSLHTLLVHVYRIKCSDCGHNLTLNSLKWEEASSRVREVWKKRVYV